MDEESDEDLSSESAAFTEAPAVQQQQQQPAALCQKNWTSHDPQVASLLDSLLQDKYISPGLQPR